MHFAHHWRQDGIRPSSGSCKDKDLPQTACSCRLAPILPPRGASDVPSGETPTLGAAMAGPHTKCLPKAAGRPASAGEQRCDFTVPGQGTLGGRGISQATSAHTTSACLAAPGGTLDTPWTSWTQSLALCLTGLHLVMFPALAAVIFWHWDMYGGRGQPHLARACV